MESGFASEVEPMAKMQVRKGPGIATTLDGLEEGLGRLEKVFAEHVERIESILAERSPTTADSAAPSEVDRSSWSSTNKRLLMLQLRTESLISAIIDTTRHVDL